jgi:hypothetical protein
VFTDTERLALAGFLAGYSGLTRQAYELDLRQFVGWCRQHQLHLFQVRRADIECFARDLEARGRARATITRRLCEPGLTRHSGCLSELRLLAVRRHTGHHGGSRDSQTGRRKNTAKHQNADLE